MSKDIICPECGENKLKYRLEVKQRPILGRYGLIGLGIILLIGPALTVALTYTATTPYSFDLWGLLAMAIGGFILWGSFNKSNEFNLHKTITAVDFQCNECNHSWDVKTAESTWDKLPPSQWQTYMRSTRIPGLDD